MVDFEMVVARYNRHGHLCAPIRFQEVITTLGNTDPRVAMRTTVGCAIMVVTVLPGYILVKESWQTNGTY